MSARDAKRKRNKALTRIATTALGTGAGSAVPTPFIETAKQIGIAVVDLWLCTQIYDIYFDMPDNPSDITDMLAGAGIVVAGFAGLTYVGYKVIRGMVDEGLNLLPGVGQLISGGITTVETGMVGLLFLTFVHDQYVSGWRPRPVSA